MAEHMNIVIVGHVDHGKSTLIGRLLYDTNSLPIGIMEDIEKTSQEMGIEVEFAYILDALEEERQQNVTIDTTQIFFKTGKREYTIIDAPGHKEFLKNMISGASLAESAILIIDGKRGIEEQTKRHAYILSLLGIKQVIVAINKMDLIDYSEEKFETIKKEILDFLNKFNIYPKFIIPIAAKLGENMAKSSEKMKWHKGKSILEALDALETGKKPEDKKLRMPIQDVYKIDNERVIVGKIESGKIADGEKIFFYPSGKSSKVKEVKEFLKERNMAIAGESIGIIIEEPLFIERGEVICNENANVTNKFKAAIFWMDKEELKEKEKISIRIATQELIGEIEKIEKIINSSTLEETGKNSISETEIANVIIKTDKNVVIESFNDIPELGRFVIEKKDVVGAGIIK